MSEMWKDHPPFFVTLVNCVGEDQTVKMLDPHETVDAAVYFLRTNRNLPGRAFIRNGNGFSAIPSKVAGPPPPRK